MRRFHVDDFRSSCGKRWIFLVQVSLFYPKMVGSPSSRLVDVVDDNDAVGSDHDAVDALTSRGAWILFRSEAETKADFAEVKRVKGGPSTSRKSTRNQQKSKQSSLTAPCCNFQRLIQMTPFKYFMCIQTVLKAAFHALSPAFGSYFPGPGRHDSSYAKGEELEFRKNKSKIFVKDFFPHLFLFLSNHFNGKLCF